MQDITLDSVHGYVYWSTNYYLESTLFNGQGHQVVSKQTRYRGRYIFGLATDLTNGQLYWLLKDSEKLIVNRATLRTHPDDNISHTEEQVVQFTASADFE